jgi:hypothetical protein
VLLFAQNLTKMKNLYFILSLIAPFAAWSQAEVQNPATLSTGAGIFWKTLGNANTTDGTHFFGTTDMKPLNFRIGNVQAGRIDSAKQNVFWGYKAGVSNTSGSGNIALGQAALFNNTDRSNLGGGGRQCFV